MAIVFGGFAYGSEIKMVGIQRQGSALSKRGMPLGDALNEQLDEPDPSLRREGSE